MGKNKLVLIFDKEDEIRDIPNCLVFNNEDDAGEYLLKNDFGIKAVEFYLNRFAFKTTTWTGHGSVYKAVDPL